MDRGRKLMKLGLHSAILADYDLEGLFKNANEIGYKTLEVCCWPKGKAERRYAGVTHIDIDNMDIEHIKNLQTKYDIEIVALGYYPNALSQDKDEATIAIEHIKKLIKASKELGIPIVSTFIGKDHTKNEEENFDNFITVWEPIITLAEENKIKIAIENCPMYFTKDEWPSGKNLASSPHIWTKMFDAIPTDYFGLAYDPSHLELQRMDILKVIDDFKDKIFHVHIKDIHVDEDKLNEYGIFTHPSNYMDFRIPGRGDIDWKEFIDKLNTINYTGPIVVEVEDRAYEDSDESIIAAVTESYEHLEPLF